MDYNGGQNKSYIQTQENSNLETITKTSEIEVHLSRDYHYSLKNDEDYKRSKISKF